MNPPRSTSQDRRQASCSWVLGKDCLDAIGTTAERVSVCMRPWALTPGTRTIPHACIRCSSQGEAKNLAPKIGALCCA